MINRYFSKQKCQSLHLNCEALLLVFVLHDNKLRTIKFLTPARQNKTFECLTFKLW